MLDPLTQISNLRGFERDIAREIARARRADQPVSVLMIDIDEYDDLHEHYGEVRGHFVLKKVAERISSTLRATDMMARLSRSRMAVLIPGIGESVGGDIAERMRRDIEEFAIDDGRGAVLQVTVSLGRVTWDPKAYPAVDMVQLAKQMEAAGRKALDDAHVKGGNRHVLSRLATLLV
jgi:diguanylate cyclase (GGDEF)-like protein